MAVPDDEDDEDGDGDEVVEEDEERDMRVAGVGGFITWVCNVFSEVNIC